MSWWLQSLVWGKKPHVSLGKCWDLFCSKGRTLLMTCEGRAKSTQDCTWSTSVHVTCICVKVKCLWPWSEHEALLPEVHLQEGVGVEKGNTSLTRWKWEHVQRRAEHSKGSLCALSSWSPQPCSRLPFALLLLPPIISYVSPHPPILDMQLLPFFYHLYASLPLPPESCLTPLPDPL